MPSTVFEAVMDSTPCGEEAQISDIPSWSSLSPVRSGHRSMDAVHQLGQVRRRMGQFRGSRGRDLARQFYHSGMSPIRMSGTRGSWHFARRHLQYEAFLSTSLPFRALPGRRISRRGLGQVLACDPRQVVELVQLRRTGPRICSSRKTGTRTESVGEKDQRYQEPSPQEVYPEDR